MTLGQSEEMTLTLNTHLLLSTHLAVCIDLCSRHRRQKFPKIYCFHFFLQKRPSSKIDIAVKQVNVNPGSPFEQTIMGWSPRSHIPSFVEIGPMVLEKMIFEGVLTCIGMAAILGQGQVMTLTFSCLHLPTFR